MMYRDDDIDCYTRDSLVCVKIPFVNGACAEFVKGLPSTKDMSDYPLDTNYTKTKCSLYVPKFEHDETIDLLPIFRDSGLSELCQTNNFNNMTENPDIGESLYTSLFKQRNMCSFDENGAEVKTVAAAQLRTRSIPFTIIFDRAFHHRIVKNGHVLISGYYNGDKTV